MKMGRDLAPPPPPQEEVIEREVEIEEILVEDEKEEIIAVSSEPVDAALLVTEEEDNNSPEDDDVQESVEVAGMEPESLDMAADVRAATESPSDDIEIARQDPLAPFAKETDQVIECLEIQAITEKVIESDLAIQKDEKEEKGRDEPIPSVHLTYDYGNTSCGPIAKSCGEFTQSGSKTPASSVYLLF